MPNPYLAQQAGAITQQYNNNLQNNILPSINSGAIAAGGFGGSRQGVAQGLAIGQSNLGLGSALAGLYGNAYENDQNRDLQGTIANQNFFTNQRAQDLNQYSLGANLSTQGNLGLSNQGQQLYQNGQQQQQAPWQNLQSYASTLSPFTGLNQSQTMPGYNSMQGAIAGGLTVAQLLKLIGG